MNVTFAIGDITEQKVDVIVNAANKWLLRGSGVCGAIHKAAGSKLEEYCRGLGGCGVGEAKISPGFNLPAKYVIHTVGPRYGQEGERESVLLADCYRNSLALAEQYHLRSICFPAISTGVYGYPVDEAAGVVADALVTYARGDSESSIEEVGLIFLSQTNLSMYKRAYELAREKGPSRRKVRSL